MTIVLRGMIIWFSHKRMSSNELVQEGLSLTMKHDEYARLYKAFGEIGEDREECDVEFAAQAQWEVVNQHVQTFISQDFEGDEPAEEIETLVRKARKRDG